MYFIEVWLFYNVVFLCRAVHSRSVVSDLVDCSPLGSPVHGILQARIPEQAAMPFSRGSSQPRDQTQVSCTAGRFFTTEPPGKPIAMWILKQKKKIHF